MFWLPSTSSPLPLTTHHIKHFASYYCPCAYNYGKDVRLFHAPGSQYIFLHWLKMPSSHFFARYCLLSLQGTAPSSSRKPSRNCLMEQVTSLSPVYVPSCCDSTLMLPPHNANTFLEVLLSFCMFFWDRISSVLQDTLSIKSNTEYIYSALKYLKI